jgi:hypothetical protein
MKNKFSVVFKILIVIISFIGILLNIGLYGNFQMLLYFTNLSNIFCFILFSVLLILEITKKIKKNEIYYIIKGNATISIIMTTIVYQLILYTNNKPELFVGHEIATLFVHIIVPLLVWFDYLIFDKNGLFKKIYPFIWCCFLLIYQVFIVIYSSLGGTFIDGSKYPYFYMDISKYGLFNSLLMQVSILFLAILIGYLSLILSKICQLSYSRGKKK